MDEQNENFDQLRKLMALKKHEVPPPGYFNRFSGEVISRIREEREGGRDVIAKLDSEAPWLMRLWQKLEAKPLFAGAFGAAICSLVLAGIYFTNKPAETPSFANQAQRNSPFIAGAADPAAPATALNTPLLLAATNLNNSAPQNLFDLAQPLQQTAPVSATLQP